MPATLKSRLPMIAAEIRPRVSAAVKAGAEMIAADAEMKAPLGPGDVHIKDHFGVERTGPAEYTVYNDAEAETGRYRAPYAKMVEFGHTAKNGTQIAPQPFMVPAKEENESEVVAMVAASLKAL